MTTRQMCPRCAHTTIDHLASSPVPGSWEVFGCPRCNYSWRDTEPANRSTRSAYPEKYRLTADDIAAAPPYPGIPPLRSTVQSRKP
jgi:hypothetical protein